MTRQRDAYADVGAAMRAAIEQVIRTRESQRELSRYARTFLAVLHATATWSRMSDGVYRAQLGAIADLDEKHLADELHRLSERGAAVWLPTRGGRGRSVVGLPGSVPVQNPLLGSIRGGHLSGPEGATWAPPGVSSGPPTEKYREEVPRVAAALPNTAALACTVCGGVELYGHVYGTLWFCERHRQDAA